MELKEGYNSYDVLVIGGGPASLLFFVNALK